MNRLNALKGVVEFAQSNLYTALAVAAISVIGSGYFFFFSSTIGPSLGNRDKFISQVADARKSLVDANNISGSKPADLQASLASAQATLTASGKNLLTNAQVNEITDNLYRYSSASGVTINDLQTQPGANQNDANSLSSTHIRLLASGDAHGLLDFVSRIKEASQRGFVINSVNVAADKTGSKLTMDITLYASASPSADARAAGQATKDPPAVTGTPAIPQAADPPSAAASSAIAQAADPPAAVTRVPPTPIPPKPTAAPVPITPTLIPQPTDPPVPQPMVYVVRPGDTLFIIARRYGTTVEAIIGANRLNSYVIRIGQQLLIPGR